MKKFFVQRLSVANSVNISASDISSYRNLLIVEMKKMGATDNDLQLVHDATIKNSIINKRKPEDVAWAILQ